jgi:hypothetical protein
MSKSHGYIDCIRDYHPLPFHHSGQMPWQTSDGIFTLIHRPAFLGTPGHVIAYVAKVPAEGYPDIWEDASHIVHSDGRVTTDASIMYPSDD